MNTSAHSSGLNKIPSNFSMICEYYGFQESISKIVDRFETKICSQEEVSPQSRLETLNELVLDCMKLAFSGRFQSLEVRADLEDLWKKVHSIQIGKLTKGQEICLKVQNEFKNWLEVKLDPHLKCNHYLIKDLPSLNIQQALQTWKEDRIAYLEVSEIPLDVRFSCKNPARKFYCYDYAFLKLNEQKAKPYLRSENLHPWPSNLFFDTENFLRGWGYEKVREKDLKAGDLIVYFNLGNQKLTARHFGIFSSPNRVVSKWGELGCLFEHDLYKIDPLYGDNVQFYRKCSQINENILSSIPLANA